MHSITIDGFKTKEAAVEFMTWYSGQGEQDIMGWMEEHPEHDNNWICTGYDEDALTMEIN